MCATFLEQTPKLNKVKSSASDLLLALDHVEYSYDGAPVVQDVDLQLARGQFAAIVGPSGAGKTTLLKLVLGTLNPRRGTITRHGDPAQARRRLRIGYVPQVDTVDWNFPVTAQQVALMGCVHNGGWLPWHSRKQTAHVRRVMQHLQIDQLADQHIRNLSGGQQQRVFLARALAAQPDLLVLDEPTSGVDMQTAEAILHLLLDLNREGMTILMTTHDLNMAAAHIPWILCLNNRLIAQGAPEWVFTDEILSQTYNGELMVSRYHGMLVVHQRLHPHGLEDVLPGVAATPPVAYDTLSHAGEMAEAEQAVVEHGG